MDTVCGTLNQATTIRFTRDTIIWTKSQATEFMNGKMVGFTKEISKMTIETGTGNSSMDNNAHIEDFGLMASKLRNKTLNQKN